MPAKSLSQSCTQKFLLLPPHPIQCGIMWNSSGANHLFGRQCNNIWFPLRQRQRPKMTQIDKATDRRCLCWPPLFVFLCCFCFKSSCSSSRLQVSFRFFPIICFTKVSTKKTYDCNKDKCAAKQRTSPAEVTLSDLFDLLEARASVALVLWLPICDYTTLQQLPPLTGLRHLVASLRWQLEAD